MKIIEGMRRPTEDQDSLRKLSRQGRALAIQDRTFNEIVDEVNRVCGVHTRGTRGYIESKLLQSKVISVERLDCTASCLGDLGKVFRSINGTCNNCENPIWGASTSTILRLLDAEYEDQKGLPRGWAQNLPGNPPYDSSLHLPSARLVSKALTNSNNALNENLTLMHFQWGQFIDHDLILTLINPESAGGEVSCEEQCSNVHPCFPILVDVNDPITNMSDGNLRSCLAFTRSAGIRFSVTDAYAYSNQINEVTAYMDASTVYGSSGFLGLLLQDEEGLLRTGPPPAGLSPDQLQPLLHV